MHTTRFSPATGLIAVLIASLAARAQDVDDEFVSISNTSGHLGLAFTPDGKYLIAGRQVWDLSTRKATEKEMNWKSGWGPVAIDPRGTRVAVGYRFPGKVEKDVVCIRVFDAVKGEEVLALRGHQSTVRALTFSADGKRLASHALDGDESVRLWDLDKGAEMARYRHGGECDCLAFSPDATKLACGKAGWPETFFLDLKLREPSGSIQVETPFGQPSGVASVAYSADGKWIAAGFKFGVTVIRRTANPTEDYLVHRPAAPLAPLKLLRHLAFSPDGRLLATASDDHLVRVWKTNSDQQPLVFQGHSSPVMKVAFDASGRRLASCDDQGRVMIRSIGLGR